MADHIISSAPMAAAAQRPASGVAAGTQSKARMELFMLVRILFQYLERVDQRVLDLAKEVLNDCEKKHSSGDSKYSSLADAIRKRVRDAVGEEHWENARRIQKELATKKRKKKTRKEQPTRMDLFLLVRILFEYLEKVDRRVLGLAKEVLKDCERKHSSGDSKYASLADAISERVRDAAGEEHWRNARRIQKKLEINRQKKKSKAIQKTAQRYQSAPHEQTKSSTSESESTNNSGSEEGVSTDAKASSRSSSSLTNSNESSSDDQGSSVAKKPKHETKKHKQEPVLLPFANVTTDSATGEGSGSTSSPSDEARGSSTTKSDEAVAESTTGMSQASLPPSSNSEGGSNSAKATAHSTSSLTNSSSDDQGPVAKKQKPEPKLPLFANVTAGSTTNEGGSTSSPSDEAQNGGSSSGNSDEVMKVDKTMAAPPQPSLALSSKLNTNEGGVAGRKRRLSRSTFAQAATLSFSEFSSLTGFSSEEQGRKKKQKQEPMLPPFAKITTHTTCATRGSTSSPSDEARNGGSSSSNSDEGLKIAKPIAAPSQGLLSSHTKLSKPKGTSQSSSSLSNSSRQFTSDSAANEGSTSPSDEARNEGSSSSNSDEDMEVPKTRSVASQGLFSQSTNSNSEGGSVCAKATTRSASSLSNSSSSDDQDPVMKKQKQESNKLFPFTDTTANSTANEGSTSCPSVIARSIGTFAPEAMSTASKSSFSLSSDSNNGMGLTKAKDTSPSMLAVAMHIWHKKSGQKEDPSSTQEADNNNRPTRRRKNH